jgi:hypothetical protein
VRGCVQIRIQRQLPEVSAVFEKGVHLGSNGLFYSLFFASSRLRANYFNRVARGRVGINLRRSREEGRR